MSNARRRALFQWYREQGFSPDEARVLRNRSKGWYQDFQDGKRTDPALKAPKWRPDAREQRQRFREAKRNGLSSQAAGALRRTSAIKFEGAQRSLKNTRDRFTAEFGAEGRRVVREELAKVRNYSGIQRAIAQVYARFRPERARPTRTTRAERAGRRAGRVR